MENLLITGATGRNGRAALAALQQAGGSHLLAATRTPGARSDATVEIHLDWEMPDTYAAALEGVSAIYLIIPEAMANAGEIARRFLDAATEAGVQRVVALSARGVEEYPGHPLAAVEQAVRQSSLDWTILKPNWFMQNFTEGVFRMNLQQGLIAAPGGSARISFIDIADIGSCAAQTLSTPSRHADKTYDLSGPEALTFEEAAEIFSRVWDLPVRYEELRIDDPELPQKLGLPAMPDPTPVQALFGRVVSGGEASVSLDVEALLGHDPSTLEEFARRTAAPATSEKTRR